MTKRKTTLSRSPSPRDKLERLATGKSHEAVARELGISRQYVQALLAGTRKFSSNVLDKLGFDRVVMYHERGAK